MATAMTVYVTTKNVDEARRIGRLVVERRLAACANIVPTIHAIYQWEGRIVEDTEALMFLKTDVARLEELTAFIKEQHSYSVPCITATAIDGGNRQYTDWIRAEVGVPTASTAPTATTAIPCDTEDIDDTEGNAR